MSISREHPCNRRRAAARVGAPGAGLPTSSALGGPRARASFATPLPRSARLAGALALLAAALAGCDPVVEGNGLYGEERRTGLAPFVGVHAESGVEVTLTAGAASQSVVVSGDRNLLPYIDTDVLGDDGRAVLRVRVSTAFTGTFRPRVVVEVPAVELALAREASKVVVKQATAPAFVAAADQGSTIVLSGPSADGAAGATLRATLAGASQLEATGYEVSEGASVDLRAGSVAKIRSDGPVTGTVAGGSDLENEGPGTCEAVLADGASTVACPGP